MKKISWGCCKRRDVPYLVFHSPASFCYLVFGRQPHFVLCQYSTWRLFPYIWPIEAVANCTCPGKQAHVHIIKKHRRTWMSTVCKSATGDTWSFCRPPSHLPLLPCRNLRWKDGSLRSTWIRGRPRSGCAVECAVPLKFQVMNPRENWRLEMQTPSSLKHFKTDRNYPLVN